MKHFLLIVTGFFILSIFIYTYIQTHSTNQESQNKTIDFTAKQPEIDQPSSVSITVPNTLIPAGWYQHQNEYGALLTKNKTLPTIGDSETYAYGSFITVEMITLSNKVVDLSAWASNRNAPTPESDRANIATSTISNFPAHGEITPTLGAEGTNYTVYVRISDTEILNFFLYSQDFLTEKPVFTQYVAEVTAHLTR